MINSTSQTMYRLDNLNNEYERVKYQQSTGKKLQYGSDDSNIFTREVYINDKIKMYEGIKSQIEKASAQNSSSDSTLASAKKLVSYIKAEVIKALNDTVNDSDRAVIAENLRGVRENLFDFANEQVEGEYLFSGSDSSIKPFIKDETTGKITYVGDNELRKVAVEEGSYRDRGINGFESFFSTPSVANVGENLNFNQDDIILDQDNNRWIMREPVKNTGEILKFYSNQSLVDDKNNIWTINNTVMPHVLEDADGKIIPINQIDAITYEVTVPSEAKTLRMNELRKLTADGNYITGEALIPFESSNGDGLEVNIISSQAIQMKTKTSMFNVLDNIINALDKIDSNGNPLTSQEAKTELQNGLTNITNAYDAMNAGHAKLGGRNHVFEISHERITAKTFQYERLQQEVSGVDLAEVAIEAKALELTYTSLYSTINRTNELSLVNFLR